jgi:hypothetical protein
MLSNAIPSLQQVVVAVGCLDGTVAIVATGISTPNATKEPSSSGTMIEYVVRIYFLLFSLAIGSCFGVILHFLIRCFYDIN